MKLATNDGETVKDLEPHKYADLFPMMEGAALQEFVISIKTQGLQQPITLFEGKILDGRNRYAACKRLGVHCYTTTYTGSTPLEYVLASNLHRRHLTTAQRAAIAAELANIQNGSNRYETKVGVQNCTPTTPEITLEKAAEVMNVSRRAAASAKKRMKDDPEAHEAVKRGEKVKAKPKAESRPKPQPHALETPAPTLAEEYVKHREEVQKTLSETAQQKFERLANQEAQLLQKRFYETVNTEIKRILPERSAKMEEATKKALREVEMYQAKRNGIEAQITEEEYKFLCSTFHPDRAPEGFEAKFSKAFLIIRKIDTYIRACKK